jgi:hypothetical protein
MKATQHVEAPSRVSCPFFLIGQDSRGRWVVCEQNGARGGLFINRAEALRYIRSETESHPCPIVIVSGILELKIGGTKNAFGSAPSGTAIERRLQVA